jgi:heme-NO-binding protein
MHGSLLHGFKEFVRAQHGQASWDAIVARTGAGGWYLATEIYPDEELASLIRTTAAHLRCPVSVLLEEFGEALVPTLMSLYQAFVDPHWRTLDLLSNTENVIHRTVRLRDPRAHPPHLRPRRVSDREVHIIYASQRGLCAVAIGICRGIAAYYSESITIEQPECMQRAASACRLIVRLGTIGSDA